MISAALAYILGCIGFALALGGGFILVLFWLDDFEGVSLRDYLLPIPLLAVGLILFIAGWPS